MGAAASIEVHHTRKSFANIEDGAFQQLLSSRAARDDLFDKITAHKLEGVQIRGKISFKKLVWYFSNPENALYPGWSVNVPTLSESFKFVIEKKNKEIKSEAAKADKKSERKSDKKSERTAERKSAKSFSSAKEGSGRASVYSSSGEGSAKAKKKVKLEQLLTRDLFNKFIPVLLLFKRFWDLFSAIDGLVVDDQKIFKGEFMRIKDKLQELQGIQILGDIPEDVWEAEFLQLDTKSNGYFTFGQTLSYVMTHVKKDSFKYGEEEVGSDKTVSTETEGEVEAPVVTPAEGLQAKQKQSWNLIDIVSNTYRTSFGSKPPPGLATADATAGSITGPIIDPAADSATVAIGPTPPSPATSSEDKSTLAISDNASVTLDALSLSALVKEPSSVYIYC
ncbi:hypothetical protein B484DRAFT_50798 [Ochromonadaceae sp. CCMP2298]|nr:hypothetical protein B484DRAFT_50798 [Ochromonadaceae sp. CCMP2298]|mmetsp:Transcript_7100/g.15527  ORF Transcript_7100/g.15527 Transcript_7100/m.15527 type:complete len:393 (+) Transcript_7100:63-1241(+)